MDAAKREKFLAALTALSREHGVAIWGCGCCGSPDLVDSVLAEDGNGNVPVTSKGGYTTENVNDCLEWREPA